MTAADGGVWIGIPGALVHYTASGPTATLPIASSGAPRHLVLASDGSIWFATETAVARMSTSGAILEQSPMIEVRDLTVANDGALWYTRAGGSVIGRIAGGVPAEFPSAIQAWSLAPAAGGDVWFLTSGFGDPSDGLYRITPLGAVTEIPDVADVLFGELQTLPDGTLLIGTGINLGQVLRLDPGSQAAQVFATLPGANYLGEAAGNVWGGAQSLLAYVGRTGVPDIRVEMPGDPRPCLMKPSYEYRPVAFDSAGGLWVTVTASETFVTLPPCEVPAPPPLPDLIRIDAATFLASHGPAHVPALSPLMLIALAAALAAVALWQFRG